jgi:hypothetical protein
VTWPVWCAGVHVPYVEGMSAMFCVSRHVPVLFLSVPALHGTKSGCVVGVQAAAGLSWGRCPSACLMLCCLLSRHPRAAAEAFVADKSLRWVSWLPPVQLQCCCCAFCSADIQELLLKLLSLIRVCAGCPGSHLFSCIAAVVLSAQLNFKLCGVWCCSG